MSETRFTPGPWWVEPMHASIDPVVSQASGRNVIACKTKPTEEEKVFNDLVMAAAPVLYEALELAANSSGFQYMFSETRDKINAALAKARGEAE